jgi:hypothetical protein
MDEISRAKLIKRFLQSPFAKAVADFVKEDENKYAVVICKGEDETPELIKARGKWLYAQGLFERLKNESEKAPVPDLGGQGKEKEGQ